MTLHLYNTLTRQKEEFRSLTPGKVKMYVCGITAYDSCHLGHARSAVVFDVVARYLKFLGYDVTYARNFTDVDDKIIKRANDEGVSCDVVTKRYIEEYHHDMQRLGLLSPTLEPKATENIHHMIATIEALIAKGFAYVLNGDVYFSVRKFQGYGKLSGKNIEELESGARVEIDERKKDPLDFALWKASKPGEPKWKSPWGEGRPGWHIECSAMSAHYLGQPFDIHGGGRDLIFPHHENEIAQAEGATGKSFANYWLHNGFININAEKMSKSLGNFFTIKDIVARHDPEVVRFFLLSSHYRSSIDYSEESLAESKAGLDRFYETLARLPSSLLCKEGKGEVDPSFEKHFRKAMDDDLNTPAAIGHVFEWIRTLNRSIDRQENIENLSQKVKGLQELLGNVLGLFHSDPLEYRKRSSKSVDATRIEQLIAERNVARSSRNFKRADEIRDHLASQGIELKDAQDGTTTWKVR